VTDVGIGEDDFTLMFNSTNCLLDSLILLDSDYDAKFLYFVSKWECELNYECGMMNICRQENWSTCHHATSGF
jgi:hypothetical protein